jgi:hypothetical protein
MDGMHKPTMVVKRNMSRNILNITLCLSPAIFPLQDHQLVRVQHVSNTTAK